MALFFFKDAFLLGKTRKWLCGRTEEGCPCTIGPDSKGHCQSKHECIPRFDGNRWHCTRPDALGGPCAQGPFPDGQCARERGYCAPILSVNYRLYMTVGWVAALAFGLCLFFLFGKTQDFVVNPGDLAVEHIAITDCKSCHALPKDHGLFNMLDAAVFHASRTRLNSKCLACHEMPSETSQMAHNVPRSRLKEITVEVAANSASKEQTFLAMDKVLSFGDHMKYEDLSCAACHSDHRGVEFDMTEMSLKQCNSCHVRKISGLTDGHPPFESYPHKRRTHIIFDHDTHMKDHFLNKDFKGFAPQSCLTCHEVLEDAQPTLLSGYEKSCAACHDKGIRNAAREGVTFLSIPYIDRNSLEKAGKKIGGWFEDADAELAPFMRVLMSGDSRYRKFAEIELVEEIDLADLSDASPAVLDAVEGLAWAIKELLYDLSYGGQKVVYERVAKIEKDTGMPAEYLTNSVSMLPVDVFLKAQKLWTPGLDEEISAYRAAQKEQAEGAQKGMVLDSLSPQAGKKRDRRVIYPKRRPADIHAGADKEEKEQKGLDNSRAPDSEHMVGQKGGSEGRSTDESDDLLNWADEETGKDNLVEESLEDGRIPVLLSAEEWMDHGGWFFDFDSLKYRPVGHADPFIRSWAELMSGDNVKTQYKDAALQVFEHVMLGGENSPGECSKCHSVDKLNGFYRVNWMKTSPRVVKKSFTKFSHRIHVGLTGKDNCSQCHVENVNSKYPEGYHDLDPLTYGSNYLQINIETCATCHNERQAQDNCTTCHNYHIENDRAWLRR